MKKAFQFLLLLVLVITFSCNRENESVASIPDTASAVDRVLVSSAFTSLSISTNLLEVKQSQFANAGRTIIAIPFVNDEKRILMAALDETGQVKTVMDLQVNTSADINEVPDQMKAGKFEGTFRLTTDKVQFSYTFQRSQIVQQSVGKSKNYNAACKGITSSGGAADCAGRRISAMNWFDAALCYARFMVCLGENVISCAIDGCL